MPRESVVDSFAPWHSRLSVFPRPPHQQYVVAQKVIQGIHPGCTTEELDALAAETAASMTTHHPDYAVVRAPEHAQRALNFAECEDQQKSF